MHLIRSLVESNADIRLLWLSSAVRWIGYSSTNQIIALYLSTLNISEFQIGIFMTLTLVGDTLLSYWFTWNADRIGRRRVMAIGATLMAISGVVFAMSSNYYVLLFAAVVGVISPSGNETGPFRSVEEASIAHLTPLNHRPEIYAFHGISSTMGSAMGSLVCGFGVDFLSKTYELEHCYRLVFGGYAVIGIMKLAIAMSLSEKCEPSYKTAAERALLIETGPNDIEYNPLTDKIEHRTMTGLAPPSQSRLFKLLATFMLDAFGQGFMPSAWMIYYFRTVFGVSASYIGSLIFITNIVDAVSALPSVYMAKAFGPVTAILLGQAPSAIFYSFVGASSNYLVASVFLIMYASGASIDIVPRQVLLTTLFDKHELTKVLGMVNIGKTFSACIGPMFAGRLAEMNRLYVGFFIACIGWLGADVILMSNFWGIDKEVLEAQSVDHSIE